MAASQRCILPVNREISPFDFPDIGGCEVIVTKEAGLIVELLKVLADRGNFDIDS